MSNTRNGSDETARTSTRSNEKDERVALPVADLRDYFAGQALVGFLSAHAHPGNEAGVSTDDAAIAAYRIADAMLKAKESA